MLILPSPAADLISLALISLLEIEHLDHRSKQVLFIDGSTANALGAIFGSSCSGEPAVRGLDWLPSLYGSRLDHHTSHFRDSEDADQSVDLCIPRVRRVLV